MIRGSANGRPPAPEAGRGGSSPSPRTRGGLGRSDHRPGRPTGRAACLRSRIVRVRIPLGPFACPRGAVRSARHPVKVEAVGSNPIEGVETEDASAGHGRAQEAVTLPPSGCAGSSPARRTDRPVAERRRRPHHKREDAGSSPAGMTDGRKGCWSNGTTPALHAGDRGSTPRRSIR